MSAMGREPPVTYGGKADLFGWSFGGLRLGLTPADERGGLMLRMLLSLTVVLGTTACATTDETLLPQAGYDTISVSVGPCYGPCPIYAVVIASDGHVRFQGRDYQRPRRLQAKFVGVARYQGVADALAPYRPPNRLPECLETSTDAQFYTIVWTDRAGTSTTLNHYSGDTCPESVKLSEVLRTIPTLAAVSQWLREPS